MKLDIIGQQFILDSQINTIQNQSAQLYEDKSKTEQKTKQVLYDTDRRLKEVSKAKMNIEAECRGLVGNLEREMQANYENKMNLEKN